MCEAACEKEERLRPRRAVCWSDLPCERVLSNPTVFKAHIGPRLPLAGTTAAGMRGRAGGADGLVSRTRDPMEISAPGQVAPVPSRH